MTFISPLILAGMFYATEPIAKTSEAVFNKRAILAAVKTHLPKKLDEMSDQEVLALFEEKMDQRVLNMKGELVDGIKAEKVDMAQEKKKPVEDRLLPFYVYAGDDGKKFYILSVRTLAGASFDHKGETPGLGAEIKDNPAFSAQFLGKTIYDQTGEFTSVVVRKGGAKDPANEVDGISGATITCNGVTEMLDRGIQYYQPYLDKLKADKQTGMK